MNKNKEYIEINKDTFPTPFPKRLNGYMQGWNDCLNSVLQHKTADVEPIQHGKWIEIPFKPKHEWDTVKGYPTYRCSICGRQELVKEPYCNCGAKMDRK